MNDTARLALADQLEAANREAVDELESFVCRHASAIRPRTPGPYLTAVLNELQRQIDNQAVEACQHLQANPCAPAYQLHQVCPALCRGCCERIVASLGNELSDHPCDKCGVDPTTTLLCWVLPGQITAGDRPAIVGPIFLRLGLCPACRTEETSP